MPASYTIRRSVPRNTRRSKPASTPSTCFPSFSINLFMAFPLPRGDLSSNTTNIIREQETPSPFGCGYAALCIRVVLPDADRSRLATLRLIRSTTKPKPVVVHSEFRTLLLPCDSVGRKERLAELCREDQIGAEARAHVSPTGAKSIRQYSA